MAFRTREHFRLVGWNCTQMLQVALVPNQHDDDVGVSVVSKLFEPSSDVDV